MEEKYFQMREKKGIGAVAFPCQNNEFTLCPNEDERYFLHVPELGHFDVVVVDGAEARLVFQAEDEDHGVHPTRKLKIRERN